MILFPSNTNPFFILIIQAVTSLNVSTKFLGFRLQLLTWEFSWAYGRCNYMPIYPAGNLDITQYVYIYTLNYINNYTMNILDLYYIN